jgi:putative FmdB family regulatory protein
VPVYDYVCTDCHTSFEAILTIKEHEQGQVSCPKCNSRKVEQEAATFYAVTSKKS